MTSSFSGQFLPALAPPAHSLNVLSVIVRQALLVPLGLKWPRMASAFQRGWTVHHYRRGESRRHEPHAWTTGTAKIVANQSKLTVTLGLRRARPRGYVLLTELSGQDDWYSNPLRIQ